MALSVKNMLGGGQQKFPYVWGKYSIEIEKVLHKYLLTESTSLMPRQYDTITIYKSSSVTFNEDTGTYTLVNPTSTTVGVGSSVTIDTATYFTINSITSNKVWKPYVSTRTVENSTSDSYGVYINASTSYTVMEFSYLDKERFVYLEDVNSDSPYTYPSKGFLGEYYYKIKDKPPYTWNRYIPRNSVILNGTKLADTPYDTQYATVVVHDNTVYLLGGNANSNKAVYTWDGNAWKTISNALPYAYYNGCSVEYNNEIHIFGTMGYSNTNAHYKSSNGTTWTSVSKLPYNVANASSIVVYNNELHLLGGGTSGKTKHYKFDGTSWIELDQLPAEFVKSRATVYNDKIHIFGGYSDTKYKLHYAWDGNTWELVSTLPYTFEDGGVISYNDHILLIGGYNSSEAYNCYAWNGETWSNLGKLPYGCRYVSPCIYNGKVEIFGTNFSSTSHYSIIEPKTEYNSVGRISNKSDIYPDGGCFTDNLFYRDVNCGMYGWDVYKKSETRLPLNNSFEFTNSTGADYSSSVIYNGKVHLFGVYNGSYDNAHYVFDGNKVEYVDDGYRYNKDNAVVVYRGKIHMMGSQNTGFYTRHYTWDEINGWVSIGTLPWSFSYGRAIVYNDEIHAFGERNSGKAHYKYNGASWTKVEDVAYDLNHATPCVYDGKIHFVKNSTHYTYDGVNWTANATLPISLGSYTGTLVYEDTLYAYGESKNLYFYDEGTWKLACIMNVSMSSGGSMFEYDGSLYQSTKAYISGVLGYPYEYSHCVVSDDVNKFEDSDGNGVRYARSGEIAYGSITVTSSLSKLQIQHGLNRKPKFAIVILTSNVAPSTGTFVAYYNKAEDLNAYGYYMSSSTPIFTSLTYFDANESTITFGTANSNWVAATYKWVVY